MPLNQDSSLLHNLPYFLRAEGEMGTTIHSYNWLSTAIGLPEQWPQSLKASLNILLNADSPMLMFWGDERILFYNDAYRTAFATDAYSAIGAGADKLSMWPEIEPVALKVFQNAEPLTAGLSDGTTFKVNALFADHEQPVGVIVTFTIKPNAAPIVNPEYRFQSLISNATVGIIVLSGEEMRVDIVNKMYGKLIDRIPEELLGRRLFDVIPETREHFHAIIENVRVTGNSLYLYDHPYFVIVNGEKKEGFLNLVFQPYTEDNGLITGVMVFCHDVTESVTTRKIADQRQHLFKQLIEESPIAISLFKGEDMVIDIANQNILELWNAHDAIGKTLLDAVPELRGQPFMDQLTEVYKTGITYSEQNAVAYLMNNNALRKYYFDYTYKPMTNSDGEIFGVMDVAIDVTEKVVAQQKIQESEQRVKSIVESAPFPIGVYVGREMTIQLANQAIIDIWGKGSEIIGKSYTEVLPELENQKVFEQLQFVYDTGLPFHGKNIQIDLNVDGKTKTYYFNYSFTPLFDADGKPYGVMNTAADVTEMNVASQKIAKSERNLRNIILQSPVAMCILMGPDFVVDIANDRMFELWGLTREQSIGRPILDCLPEAKNAGVEELLSNVYKTGERFAASELPVILPRGGSTEVVYLNFVYEAFINAEGEVAGVMAVGIDVSEQVIARKKIEQAEETARLAIESADLASYEVDLRTNNIEHSARFFQIMGQNGPVPRSVYTSQFHPDDVAIRANAHQEALNTGNLHYEARVIHPDDSIHWIRAKGIVVYDEEKNPQSLIGIIQDITDQKQFAEELSKQVRKQTLELKRSNEDLLQFAHVASHDLKEPVRKIKVFVSRIEEEFATELPDRAKTYLGKIHNATNRMFSMIEGVLTYSTLNSTEQKLDEVDLNKIFKNIENDLEILIQQKKATFNVKELPVIEGAQVLIYQLFYNLINNSLKFSRNDVPAVIDVSCEVENRYGHDLAKITITDNGIGLDPEYALHIFGAFARLNAKELYEGTGLGLSLCKRIVERHFGSISATGKVNDGATFTVILPLKQFESYV